MGVAHSWQLAVAAKARRVASRRISTLDLDLITPPKEYAKGLAADGQEVECCPSQGLPLDTTAGPFSGCPAAQALFACPGVERPLGWTGLLPAPFLGYWAKAFDSWGAPHGHTQFH